MRNAFAALAKFDVLSIRLEIALANSLLSVATFLLAVSTPISARGDFVSASYSGPGGSGATQVGAGTLIEPTLTYTSIGLIDISITVDSADTYYISETSGNSVHNTTGVAWSGFTWELISNPSGSLVYDPTSPAFSGVDFQNHFQDATGTATFATFTGGTVLDGQFVQPAFRFGIPSAGTYTIRETPIAVPEPSAIVLAALACVGLVVWGRRRNR